jgi:hypothetical protein
MSESAVSSDESSDSLRDAVSYWERRRIVYNLVLAAIAVGWYVVTWPHFRGALTPRHLFALAVLALCANACYCAAYFIDLPMQAESTQRSWRRHRWMLFGAGMLLAILLENYWIADEIYPYLD